MYCTIDQLKERLNITGTTEDAMLGALINATCAWVDLYCHRPAGAFAVQADSTRYYDRSAVCGQTLTLEDSVLSVTTLINGNGTPLLAGTYRLQPRNAARHYQITLRDAYAWQWLGDNEIEITGKFGYSLAPPAPVREAALHFAGWQFKRYQAALQDATINFELGEIRYSKRVPETVLAYLDLFVDRSKTL